MNIDFFTQLAKENLKNEIRLADDISCMPAGANGPYFDLETPVRNTAHWLYTYCYLYQKTSHQEFKDIASRLSQYLLKTSNNREAGVYIHRQKSSKDWCNGVIGQAWVIEALNLASLVLERVDLKERALEDSRAFKFHKAQGAWSKTDPFTKKCRIDYTLNHQIWFAASLCELHENSLDVIDHFLTGLKRGHFQVREDGLIAHLHYASSFKSWALRSRYRLSEFKSAASVRHKEVGYHLYNLHPLARIYKRYGNHEFFKSESFKKALSFVEENEFWKELENNKYAYPYNAPAFEFPLVVETFELDTSKLELAQKKQMEKTFHQGLSAFYNNCPDPLVLNARIYEALLSRESI